MQNNMGKGRIKQGIITDEKCVTGKIKEGTVRKNVEAGGKHVELAEKMWKQVEKMWKGVEKSGNQQIHISL